MPSVVLQAWAVDVHTASTIQHPGFGPRPFLQSLNLRSRMAATFDTPIPRSRSTTVPRRSKPSSSPPIAAEDPTAKHGPAGDEVGRSERGSPA